MYTWESLESRMDESQQYPTLLLSYQSTQQQFRSVHTMLDFSDFHSDFLLVTFQYVVGYSRFPNMSVTLLLFSGSFSLQHVLFPTQFLNFSTQWPYTPQLFQKFCLLHYYSDLSHIRNSRVILLTRNLQTFQHLVILHYISYLFHILISKLFSQVFMVKVQGLLYFILVQSNLAIRNVLIRNLLVLRNHFP